MNPILLKVRIVPPFHLSANCGKHLLNFVCLAERRNKIVDFESPALNDIPFPTEGLQGFEIHDFTVQFMGRCSDCRKGK